MKYRIDIEGREEIERKLGKLLAWNLFREAAVLSAKHIEGKVRVYPQAGPGNKPRKYSPGAGWGNFWYERGFGSRWARADGSVGSRATSETLGKSWTVQPGRVSATLGTNVSYARFVQGPWQTVYHARRGWGRVDKVIEQESITIVKIYTRQIDRALRG